MSGLGSTVRAQVVIGRVREAQTGAPIGQVTVQALDSIQRLIAQRLSSPDGTYRLPLPSAGKYTIRASKIGFRPAVATRVAVSDNSATHDFELTPLPVSLPAARTSADRDCRVNERDSDLLLHAWQAARARVGAQDSLSGDWRFHIVTMYGHEDAFRYHDDPAVGPLIRAPHRELDSSGAREDVIPSSFAETPAEVLLAQGYVTTDSGGQRTFDAPNAKVLLSDAFAARHCFTPAAAPSDHRDWTGVRFERKVGAGASPSDIDGVFWLDTAMILRRVQFEYTGLEADSIGMCHILATTRGPARCSPVRLPMQRLSLGGEVDFAEMRGATRATHWIMRTPPDTEVERFSGNRVKGSGANQERCFSGPGCVDITIYWPRLVLVEGSVIAAYDSGMAVYHDSATARLANAIAIRRAGARPTRLEGRVTDIENTPLPSAIVEFPELGTISIADSSGHFVAPPLPPGRTAIAVRCRGYKTTSFSLDVRSDSTQRARLVLPAAALSSQSTGSPRC